METSDYANTPEMSDLDRERRLLLSLQHDQQAILEEHGLVETARKDLPERYIQNALTRVSLMEVSYTDPSIDILSLRFTIPELCDVQGNTLPTEKPVGIATTQNSKTRSRVGEDKLPLYDEFQVSVALYLRDIMLDAKRSGDLPHLSDDLGSIIVKQLLPPVTPEHRRA